MVPMKFIDVLLPGKNSSSINSLSSRAGKLEYRLIPSQALKTLLTGYTPDYGDYAIIR